MLTNLAKPCLEASIQGGTGSQDKGLSLLDAPLDLMVPEVADCQAEDSIHTPPLSPTRRVANIADAKSLVSCRRIHSCLFEQVVERYRLGNENHFEYIHLGYRIVPWAISSRLRPGAQVTRIGIGMSYSTPRTS
jgi:hypothetical protein